MIRHTVAFKLKHESGSGLELDFLDEAKKLADLPGVKTFQCMKQISEKNNFDFGLSMEFDSMDDYEDYNNHPVHSQFVQNRWIPEVLDFIEIDYDI